MPGGVHLHRVVVSQCQAGLETPVLCPLRCAGVAAFDARLHVSAYQIGVEGDVVFNESF
jgi:hypothetical protein